jgi:hypothetical protein
VHVLDEPGEEVRSDRVYIIIIVGGVVSLQAVSGIYEQHVVVAVGRADTVNVIVHGEKGLLDIPARVSGIEPGTVYVVRRKDGKRIFTTPQPVSAGKKQQTGG